MVLRLKKIFQLINVSIGKITNLVLINHITNLGTFHAFVKLKNLYGCENGWGPIILLLTVF